MTDASANPQSQSDSAAIFAIAMSLWEACHKSAKANSQLNLSEAYNGLDQFMREIMQVASEFESWACHHIEFAELDEPWPYLLQDHFGETCLQVLLPDKLAVFDASDCLRVALLLGLSVKLDSNLPVPVDVIATNPFYSTGSGFRKFRIQTVRNSVEDNDCVVYSAGDDPFDSNFGPPYFGLYGVGEDGLSEHIADRTSYSEAVRLAQKLAPGVNFSRTSTVGATSL
jgi:hypothetical protein